uniref:Uncharacterized protein n=1 Tax=Anguilla anguilla TaxID=7936 RepID=A0A0E9Q105_ANGAN
MVRLIGCSAWLEQKPARSALTRFKLRWF